MRVAAFAIAMALALPAAAAAQPAKFEIGPWAHFEVWLSAIEAHAPGGEDEALISVLRLDASQLEAVIPHMVFTLREAFEQEPRHLALDEFFAKYGTRGYKLSDPAPLKEAGRRIVRSGLDRFLKRAAMLHADLGFMFPRSHYSRAAGTSHLVADGRNEGDQGRPWHWMLGRAFLHLVSRREEDAFVRLWYQAVANNLLTRRTFTESEPHLDRALQLFPRDAELLFARGWFHEAHAAPVIQGAMTERLEGMTPVMRKSYDPVVKGKRVEEAFALEAFRKAVQADPAHVEARIRFGRMLTLVGKPADAVTHLREALRMTEDGKQRYVAQLFLGAAEFARGQHAEARAAYRAAADLAPGAQSPEIAIAQIDLHAGDREAIARLLAFLSAASDVEDPWWDYHSTRVPAPDVWFARLREALRAEVR